MKLGPTLLRKKLLPFLLIILSIAFIDACRQPLDAFESDPNLQYQSVQAWFQDSYADQFNSNRYVGKSDFESYYHTRERFLEWGEMKRISSDNKKYLQVPISYPGEARSQIWDRSYDKFKAYNKSGTREYLLIQLMGNSFSNPSIIKIIGEDLDKQVKEYSPIEYRGLKLDESFSGMVVETDIFGKSIEGIRFTSGSVTSEIVSDMKEIDRLSNARYSCVWEETVVDHYTKACPPSGKCTITYIGSTTYVEKICTDNSDGPSSPSSPSPTPTPGGDPQSLGVLGWITASSNLNENDKKRLEQTLKELLDKCSYNNLYNSIKGDGFRINWRVDASSKYPGTYDPKTKTITFQSSSKINPIVLAEELFHAHQDNYYNGTTKYLETVIGRSNIEFEAKLLYDMNFIASNDYCCLGDYGSAEYHGWLLEVTEGGTKVPSKYFEFQGRYFEFLKAFKENPLYDFPIDYSLLPTALLSQGAGC